MNIDFIIHDRVETFYELFKMLPKSVPVTREEYHQLEQRMKVKCLCNDKIGRMTKPLSYLMGIRDIVIVIDDRVAGKFREHGIIVAKA